MKTRWLDSTLVVSACFVALACGNQSDSGVADDGFVADNPNYGGDDGAGDDGEGGTGAAGDGGDDAGNGGDDPGRAIAEADIVHVEGDTLYALSAFGGLAVIDVSDPDNMKMLGRFRAHAQPFEMYVDGTEVFVMYADYGSYEFDEEVGGYAWRTSSKLVALDASNPAQIVARGEFDMPGFIQDSRRVGDVLYLVTHEDGYCWGCESKPNTTISSLDVSDPARVEMVDQLRLTDDGDDVWSWSRRSVTATDERLYIAGPEYDGEADWDDQRSVIDVVDISDPGGTLERGAVVPVAGQITSRWQMDEHEGVLRVVSQPGFWGSDNPPVIETFSVESAESVQPLASLTMVLPRPESLRSVRFDGDRGYAITFERVDPLFTLDFSDPGAPRQVGELEIPGWVHHMEPRGDRLLGLGFDPDHQEGSLNVSLFDVADLDNPTMLSRVHFGGDWGGFAEDQNRIHKSFSILEELGLLLIPFSGWDWDDEDEFGCYGQYNSGIQLVDWADDALVRRGAAPAHGRARRALVHRDRLIGMSDKSVEAFDISDRDVPLSTGDLPLATNVSQIGFGDGLAVRLSRDWWSDETILEVTAAEDAESPEVLGQLDLHSVLEGDSGVEGCWYWNLYSAEIVVHEGFAYLLRQQGYEYYGEAPQMLVDVIDLTDPSAPQFVESVSVETNLGHSSNGIVNVDELRLVRQGDAIVIASGSHWWNEDQGNEASIHVIDLSTPGAPVVRDPLLRKEALSHGALQVFGDDLVSWHMAAANDNASKVRFYLDRIDVSNPAKPKLLAPINVPGVVVGYDGDSGRALTVDYQLQTIAAKDVESCYRNPQAVDFDDISQGQCTLAHRPLKLLQIDDGVAQLIGTLDVESDGSALRAVATSSERVFAHRSRGGYYWEEPVQELPKDDIAVLAGWTSGELQVASSVEVGGPTWWVGGLRALGTSLAFHANTGLAVVDTNDAAKPELTLHDLIGWGCWNMRVVDGAAICPMGEYGLQSVPLP